MTLPPPRQTYKALLWDYEWLSSLSNDECCYSLSEREIQIILSQLDYISWKTRYQPGALISQETIDNWQGNLARKLMTGCCPDETMGRYGEGGVWEESTDGGLTYHPAPENDPRNNYVGAPPLPGEASGAKRCAAADNVRDQFLGQRDYVMSLLEAGTSLIALVAGIMALLAVIAGASGIAIGASVLIMGMASALLSLTPESVEAQIDTTALDTFRCLVYCNMNNDGQLTYDAWLNLLAQISEEFNDFPKTFFYSTTNAWGYIGMNNAGTIGAATAEDCADCDCFTTCGDPDLFYAGTVNSVTDNGDGTVTVNVSSVTAPDSTEYIGWGDRENPASQCCVFLEWIDLTPGVGSQGGAIQMCGSGSESGTLPLSGQCYHFFLLYHNFNTSLPFTADIIFGTDC